MGVYTRFKKSPDGMRQLVELIESTPLSRRQKMIDVGMLEDPGYTQRALSYVIVFEDILKMPDMELAEVLGATPGRFTGYAIWAQSEEVKNHFLSKSSPRAAAEAKEILESKNVTPGQIVGAQMKLIENARKLEKRGLLKTKRIEA
jgi:flagellar motor switch protein FliG